ncbi:MAG: hypothetical protein L0154_09670 [Chloroflexi bacterium]|nr:hypothetical protein [Chloroflexota bacterium]
MTVLDNDVMIFKFIRVLLFNMRHYLSSCKLSADFALQFPHSSKRSKMMRRVKQYAENIDNQAHLFNYSRLTAEEQWLFDQDTIPDLPLNFPMKSLLNAIYQKYAQLSYPILESACALNSESLTSQQETDHLNQILDTVDQLQSFNLWVVHYLHQRKAAGQFDELHQ